MYSTYLSVSSVQSFSHVLLFATPWTAAHQVSLSITNSQGLLKLISIESVMPSNHLILYCPLLLLPSIYTSISVFSNESVLPIRWPKYWSFSFTICSNFGDQEKKVCHCFHCFSIYLPEVMGPDSMIFVFWITHSFFWSLTIHFSIIMIITMWWLW